MSSPAMPEGYPRVPAQQGWIGLLTSADLDERVGERHTTAPFREGVVGQRVGHHRIGMMAIPPAPWDAHQTWPDTIGDSCRHLDRGPVVEDPRGLAVDDAALGSVVCAHLQER